MADLTIKRGTQSNILRIKLLHATTKQGLTGLAIDTSGLIIATLCDNEATAVAYTALASTIETVGDLGTFVAPTATKCRFAEVDTTNFPGLYEFQFANARFAVASSRNLRISVLGAANLLECEYNVELVAYDPADTVRMGLTSLPNAASNAAGGLPVSTAGALDLDSIKTRVDLALPAVAAGAASGLAIVGSAMLLADSASHGGTATVITFKKLVGATSTAGESVISLTASGSGNSHGIVVNATNGKAIALGSTNNDGVSIDSSAAKGLNINGATADIDANITGNITGDITGSLSGSVDSVTDPVSIAASQLAIKKNTQLANFTFPMYATSDHVTPLTGVTVTATRSIDGGAFGACTNSVSEIGTTGMYKITLAAGDLNGTVIVLKFTGTDADPTIVGIVTQA